MEYKITIHDESETIELAENFESEYKNLDFSETQIKIPNVQQVYEMEIGRASCRERVSSPV